MPTLGEVVAANARAERARQRLRQAQVAEALGVSVSSISDLENGDRRVSVDELLPLCRVLQCDLPTLLKGLSEEDRKTLGL